MDDLKMFIPLTKVDEDKRLVYGVATAELVDRSGEICDYATTKPNYERWSAEIAKASGGKSLGNLRSMHGKTAAGKIEKMSFDDESKQILVCAKVVDDNEWKKVLEGVYTGFSQGGSYQKRWDCDLHKGRKRYTAVPTEISLVDTPCLASATFEVVKADGHSELQKFVVGPPDEIVKTVAVTLAKICEMDDSVEEITPLARQALVKYEEDQARDSNGRFAAGSGGGDDGSAGVQEHGGGVNWKQVGADFVQGAVLGGVSNAALGPAGIALGAAAGGAAGVLVGHGPVGSVLGGLAARKAGTYAPALAGAGSAVMASRVAAVGAAMAQASKDQIDLVTNPKGRQNADELLANLQANHERGKKYGPLRPRKFSEAVDLMKSVGDEELYKLWDEADFEELSSLDEVEQVWKALDGSTHAKKADALAKNAQIRAGTREPDAIDKALGRIAAVVGDQSELHKAERQGHIDVLQKYLGEEVSDASSAISAMQSLMYLFRKEKMEDNDAQASALKDAIGRIKDFVVSEIMENPDLEVSAPGMYMAAKAEFQKRAPVVTVDVAALSAEDRETLAKRLADLPALLVADADLAKGAGALEKVTGERDALVKRLDEITPKLEGFADQMEKMSTELDNLKRQPVAPPVLRVVEKSGDVTMVGSNPDADKNIQEMFSKMEPQEKAVLLVKLAQAQPRPLG